ncbi:MAG: hypothetical protein ABFS56_27885 [Pseudomonadota bacterium]
MNKLNHCHRLILLVPLHLLGFGATFISRFTIIATNDDMLWLSLQNWVVWASVFSCAWYKNSESIRY